MDPRTQVRLTPSHEAAEPESPSARPPFARVTDDPVKIANLRHALAFEALVAVRPGQREERDLARQVLDLAAGEYTTAIADRKAAPPAVASRVPRALHLGFAPSGEKSRPSAEPVGLPTFEAY